MLTATIAPENAIEKAVMWMSSDATVATVDNNGLTGNGRESGYNRRYRYYYRRY